MDDATMNLHRAASADNLALAKAALAAGANVNSNEPGVHNTPLHFAVCVGNTDIPKLLIENGADVNAANTFNDTPLHHAARSGDQATVDLLIASGAHANSKNGDGLRPSDLARLGGHHQIAQRVDDTAKQQGHANKVVEYRESRKGPPQVGG